MERKLEKLIFSALVGREYLPSMRMTDFLDEAPPLLASERAFRLVCCCCCWTGWLSAEPKVCWLWLKLSLRCCCCCWSLSIEASALVGRGPN